MTGSTTRGVRGILPLVCGLLLLSGGAGLIYQVAWVRLLGLAFGVTVYAVSTVLAAFMGGLAIGSIVGGRWADRSARPLRTYGFIELAVGATALATPWAFTGLQDLYRAMALGLDPEQAPLVAGVVRGVLVFALLLVPTGLMGMTLPLAVKGARRAVDVAGDSRAMGALYALNTTGAVIGTLAAGFVLIGGYGLHTTILAAAACNLAAGLGGLLLARLTHEHAATPLSTNGSLAHQAVETATASTLQEQRLGRAAFWVFGLSGLVSLAYEVVWSRILAILFDSSIYGFVLMLATVLVGIAVGSALSGALVSWRPEARFVGRAFGWIEMGIGLAAVVSIVTFGGASHFLNVLHDLGGPIFGRLLRTEPRMMAMLCVVTVLPAALLMGATFPPAARLWAAGAGSLGSRLGGVYAGNVAGGIVGSLAAGFLLVPVLGAHVALMVLAAANVLLGVVLLGVAESGGSRSRVLPVGALALGALAVGWGSLQPPINVQVFKERVGHEDLLWYREGLENTVSVTRDPASNVTRLYTNNYTQTNDTPDLVRYHEAMGHLATLLTRNPQPRVLVVGIGGGATPGAIAQHTGSQVELVELSEAVVEAAPWFAHINGDLLHRPNVSLRIDDGRNFLLRNRQPYDIITADIVPPSHAGAANLYSVEYFRLAARSLAPGGVMVQWVSPENAFYHETIIRTFLQAFPYATLWLTGDLLIGSNEPIQVDPAEMQRRLGDPGPAASLANVGFLKSHDVLFQFKADTDELHRYVGDGPILTDDRPLLEYFYSLDVPYAPADLSHFSADESEILAPGS